MSEEKGVLEETSKEQKRTSKLKNIKLLSSTLLEIGCMTVMIFITILFIILEEEKHIVFFLIMVILILLFLVSLVSWHTLFVLYFVSLWYFWIFLSFGYFIQDSHIEIPLYIEIVVSFCFFSMVLMLIEYKKNLTYYLAIIVFLFDLIPFEFQNAFENLLISTIRMCFFLCSFVIQGFLNKLEKEDSSFEKHGNTKVLLVMIRNNYIFFSNIWVSALLFSFQNIFMLLKLFKKWSKKNSPQSYVEYTTTDQNNSDESSSSSSDEEKNIKNYRQEVYYSKVSNNTQDQRR